VDTGNDPPSCLVYIYLDDFMHRVEMSKSLGQKCGGLWMQGTRKANGWAEGVELCPGPWEWCTVNMKMLHLLEVTLFS
jgi:hypothetical protein